MKKVTSFFFFLLSTTSVVRTDYEIFEYSIQDIRMRKKLKPSLEKEIEILVNEYVATSDARTTQLESNCPTDFQEPYDLITIKNLEIIHDKKKSASVEKKIKPKPETKDLKQVKPIPEKKAPSLKKEFDPLTVKPLLTKKTENAEDNNSAQKSKMTLSIQNNISQEMIIYHHWSGSYTPEFSLIIDEKVIPANTDITIPIKKLLKIEYKAMFPYGYSSADFIHYECKPSVKKIIVEFNWNKTPRIIVTEIDNG